jgi:hypothetical protein
MAGRISHTRLSPTTQTSGGSTAKAANIRLNAAGSGFPRPIPQMDQHGVRTGFEPHLPVAMKGEGVGEALGNLR